MSRAERQQPRRAGSPYRGVVSEEQWAALRTHLAPRPSPRTGKLSVALRADLAAALDRRRGRIPIADVLRTALLRAAEIPYQPIPTVAPWPAPVPPPLAEPKAAAAASTGSLPTIEEARSELERRYTDLERQLAETRREGKELSRRWKRHADKLARELAAARSELAVHERDAPRTVEWIKRLQQQVIDLGGEPVDPGPARS